MTPIFRLHPHNKANSCHKGSGRFIPTYGRGGHGLLFRVGLIRRHLQLLLLAGSRWTNDGPAGAAAPAHHGVNRSKPLPARCFLEKRPSQIKADIENIRLSMMLRDKFKFIMFVCFLMSVCVCGLHTNRQEGRGGVQALGARVVRQRPQEHHRIREGFSTRESAGPDRSHASLGNPGTGRGTRDRPLEIIQGNS